MNAAAMAAMIEAATPIQKVWATAEFEGLVDARDDVADERLDRAAERLGNAGQDGRAEIANAGQLVEVDGAACGRLAEPGHDRRRHICCDELRANLLEEARAEDGPDDRQARPCRRSGGRT